VTSSIFLCLWFLNSYFTPNLSPTAGRFFLRYHFACGDDLHRTLLSGNLLTQVHKSSNNISTDGNRKGRSSRKNKQFKRMKPYSLSFISIPFVPFFFSLIFKLCPFLAGGRPLFPGSLGEVMTGSAERNEGEQLRSGYLKVMGFTYPPILRGHWQITGLVLSSLNTKSNICRLMEWSKGPRLTKTDAHISLSAR